MHFNGRHVLGYYDEIYKNGFSVLEVENRDRIENSLREILELYKENNYRTEILSSFLIDKLLTEIILEKNEIVGKDIHIPKHVTEAKKYVELHFREVLSLDCIAKEIGVSKFHLSHEYKKYIGFPINEYIIRCRLSHAKELLRFTDKTVAEISEVCGFTNPSYFVRLFRTKEGITPRQYRTKW